MAGFTVILAFLVAIPYAAALLRPPDGQLLAKTLYYGNDLSQYVAAMGDGATSASWLIYDHLTAEPHSPALMYPFYVALGKLSRLMGISYLPVFCSSVAIALPVLVFSAYAFAAAFSRSVRTRRTALVLLLLGTGLGIWAAAFMMPAQGGSVADTGLSYDRAEVSSYLLPFGPPHLTLALALLLMWGRFMATWAWYGRRGSLIALAGAVVGIGLLNPFTLATLVALSIGCALIRWISPGGFPSREVGAVIVVGMTAAPFLVVNLLTFSLDPFWSTTYGIQNATRSSPPWILGIDFGLLLPLALIGAIASEERREGRMLLGFWVLSLLALMYLPVPYQRRFGFGLQPALAVLAALGLVHSESWLRQHWPRLSLALLGFRTAMLTGLFSGTMLGYSLLLMAAGGGGPLGATIFQPSATVKASGWLASHSDEKDVVLASSETSNYLAGRIPGRVMVGHKAGTLDFSAKEEMMKRFFNPAASLEERLDLAAAGRVTVVFLGEKERGIGGAGFLDDSFKLVYDAEGVRIYRLESGLF